MSDARSDRVDLRLTPAEKLDWTTAAERAGLDLSAYIRRCVKQVREVEEATARADAEAERRAQRLARLTPPEIRLLSRRGVDVDDWPAPGERAEP